MFELLNVIPAPIVALLGFILTISLLVTIHEYGHFWVARKFGVKIEKFSIGFGKPIIKWYGKRDHTEYSISSIPLGGYVKMYGETPDDVLNNNESSQDTDGIGVEKSIDHKGSFSALSPFKQLLIAFAGPGVNLIFAIFVLWILFIIGVPALKPYVGSIAPDSLIAKTTIQPGERIVAVNGQATTTLSDTTLLLVDQLGQSITTLTTQNDDGDQQSVTIDMSGLPSGSELAIEKALGFNWEIAEAANQIPATLDTVVTNSPADHAGLQSGDTIVQANHQTISNWVGLVDIIHHSANQAIPLTVINQQGIKKSLVLTPKQHADNPSIGYAGISPAFEGDLYAKYRSVKRFSLLAALPMAIKENYLQAKLTLKMLGRLIVGKASIKNMGGPLTIADYSGKSLKMGYVSYFKYLAAISLALAVMNLLPIPVLDGGHILLCSIEMVRGKPLGERTANLLLRIGMSVMITFMLLVITVDLWKYILH